MTKAEATKRFLALDKEKQQWLLQNGYFPIGDDIQVIRTGTTRGNFGYSFDYLEKTSLEDLQKGPLEATSFLDDTFGMTD